MANFIDLTGKKIGKWSVIQRATERGEMPIRWFCRCDCGTEKMVMGGNLYAGTTKSCGSCRERLYIKPPEYSIWQMAKDRCFNPRSKNYNCYGGRGITMCDAWKKNFSVFLFDMGPRPTGYTLERKDNNGPYSPENCCWETRRNQSINTRRTRLYTIDGETLCLKDWANRSGINYRTLQDRLDHGWPIKNAVFVPANPPGHRHHHNW